MNLTITRFDPTLDLEDFYYLYQHPSGREFFRRVPLDLKKSELGRIEEITQSRFYKISLPSGCCVGFGVLAQVDPYGLSGQSGIIILPEIQGKKFDDIRIGRLALRDLCAYLFSISTLNKISFRFLAHREGIAKSLLRGGCIEEANFRQSVYFQGKFHDEKEFSILKEDFLKTYGDLLCPH